MLKQARSKNHAEHFIDLRRVNEDRVVSLQALLKIDAHAKEFARFENKGIPLAENNTKKRLLAEYRKKHQDLLDERREKLRISLQQEQEQFNIEIKALEETPEQVRARMAERVKELKEIKEKERQEFVKQQLERKSRGEADELRQVETEISELKTKHLREIQMLEKHGILQKDHEDEMIYAELWKRDIARKTHKELEEMLERKLKNKDRAELLKYQMVEKELERRNQKELRENEKRMLVDLRENWKSEEERHQIQQRELFEQNKELNRELYDHNIQQRRLKDDVLRAEKQSDKEMVDAVTKREQMLDAYEREAKERSRKETRDFLLNFMNRSDELRQDDAEFERLVNEENERQWRKRMDVWQREEDARIRLMLDVYQGRDEEIMKKTDKHHLAKEAEKEQVTRDIIAHEQEALQKKVKQFETNKEHQTAIVTQAKEKAEMKKKMLMDKLSGELREIEEQLQYLQWVKKEKEEGKRALEKLRNVRVTNMNDQPF